MFHVCSPNLSSINFKVECNNVRWNEGYLYLYVGHCQHKYAIYIQHEFRLFGYYHNHK